jgi:SAM-dependent methyltransferase
MSQNPTREAWKGSEVAGSGTHHTKAASPLYDARFDEVLKFHEPGLAPVRRGGDAWHIRPDGTAAYPQRHRRTFGFYEGLAAVSGIDGWFHINPDGAAAYSARFSWCGNFQGGRCAVRDVTGRYFHILPSGAALGSKRWRYAGDYRDGVAVVMDEHGRSTHIDAAGELLHGRCFSDLDVYHKGFARARDGGGWTHIDVEGNPVYTRRFAQVEPFYNGQSRVECFDGSLETIDETGGTLVQLRPALRSAFAELSGDMVGFWRTQTLGAAVQLGIFDSLPATSEALAATQGIHEERTARLLRALGELGVVSKNADGWELTAKGAYLRSDHPLTLADAAREYADQFSQLWTTLPTAMGNPSAWQPPGIFHDVASDPARCASHHRMLRSYARHDYPAVVQALQLAGSGVLIDAGGGSGFLAAAVKQAYPAWQVTLLDYPAVTALFDHNASPDVEPVGADLFDQWPLKADAIVVARVLHDWDDDAARKILSRAREALRPSGRLFIVEMVLDEGRYGGGMCDLHLLMVTGGKERTQVDFAALLESAGFELVESRSLAALPSILVAVPR